MTGFPWDHVNNRAVLADDLNAAFVTAYNTANTAFTNAVNALAYASSAMNQAEMAVATLTSIDAQLLTLAPIANPVFQGTVVIPAGAQIGGYLTNAQASALYQANLGYVPYNAANPATYQTAAQVATSIAAQAASDAAAYQPMLGYTAYNASNPAGYQTATQVFATMAAAISSSGGRSLELMVNGDIPVGIMHDQFGMPVYVPQ